jgi:hypothetical protein
MLPVSFSLMAGMLIEAKWTSKDLVTVRILINEHVSLS